MVVAFVVVLAIAIGAACWLRGRQATAPAPASREARPAPRFGSVELRTRSGACRAARALVGQRLLAKDAPVLPLPSCTSVQCSCTFAKLADRRTDIRRLLQGSLSASLFAGTNRRAKRDRRAAKPEPPK
jgi:hypothetical protein